MNFVSITRLNSPMAAIFLSCTQTPVCGEVTACKLNAAQHLITVCSRRLTYCLIPTNTGTYTNTGNDTNTKVNL